jgi:DNA-binding transcriptional LysR family regulator
MTALDDLALLRSYVRIAESGSISAAARTLNIPQPTLSRHLRLLEVRAEVGLLRRDTHTMSLTEAGYRLLADARAILTLADSAQHRLKEDKGQLSGPLRLFSTIDLGQFLVTRIISEFLILHPGITVELSYSNQPLKMIEGGFDAGVVVGQISDQSVVARPAGEVVRYLLASPRVTRTRSAVKRLSDLKAWPWLVLSGPQFGDPKRVMIRSSTRKEEILKIQPVLTIEGATGLREAARCGLGVAQLAEWLTRQDLESSKLIRLLPEWHIPALPVTVIHPSTPSISARTRAFVEFSTRRITEELQVQNG